jgi:hypothetical protein
MAGHKAMGDKYRAALEHSRRRDSTRARIDAQTKGIEAAPPTTSRSW